MNIKPTQKMTAAGLGGVAAAWLFVNIWNDFIAPAFDIAVLSAGYAGPLGAGFAFAAGWLKTEKPQP